MGEIYGPTGVKLSCSKHENFQKMLNIINWKYY